MSNSRGKEASSNKCLKRSWDKRKAKELEAAVRLRRSLGKCSNNLVRKYKCNNSNNCSLEGKYLLLSRKINLYHNLITLNQPRLQYSSKLQLISLSNNSKSRLIKDIRKQTIWNHHSKTIPS